jgi:hypothetical protein
MAIDFQLLHTTFNGLMLDLCTTCQGYCEKTQIAVLLPGEETFIAHKLEIPRETFLERYCTTVLYGGHSIYLLKVGVCPFLNNEYRCELEGSNCKPITGMLYPVLICLREGAPEIFVDEEHCPMAAKISPEFKQQAFSVYESIKEHIPLWWLGFLSEYDNCLYDYEKLEKIRDKQHISPDELRQCMK